MLEQDKIPTHLQAIINRGEANELLIQHHKNNPDDMFILNKPNQEDREAEIDRLEQIISHQSKRILEQSNNIHRLTEENKRLKDGLYGHLKTSHVTNY